MGSYIYDAENRITVTAGVTYSYDGDGRRVQKSNGKLYWYGMSGLDALLETDLAGNTPTEYIFFGGKRTARRDSGGAVSYFFADHLGSSRIVTNASGTVVEDSDYYPFGGERVVFNNDPNQYKFTGKERDTESNLDYFVARYYSSAQGRFLSPDEFAGGPVDAFSSNDPLPPGPLPYADIINPQSLNKYTYTWNNPGNLIDPDGHNPAAWEFVRRIISHPTTQRAVQVGSNLVQRFGMAAGRFFNSQKGHEVIEMTAELVSGAHIPGSPKSKAVGEIRELAVAQFMRGQVTNRKVVSETFSAAMQIDVENVTTVGYVGGPAKGFNLPSMIQDLKILQEYASKNNIEAKAFFELGTSDEVLEAARKVLGNDNVVVFQIVVK